VFKTGTRHINKLHRQAQRHVTRADLAPISKNIDRSYFLLSSNVGSPLCPVRTGMFDHGNQRSCYLSLSPTKSHASGSCPWLSHLSSKATLMSMHIFHVEFTVVAKLHECNMQMEKTATANCENKELTAHVRRAGRGALLDQPRVGFT
jgi:hypothetical protein